jgi:YD repeat-containing protein
VWRPAWKTRRARKRRTINKRTDQRGIVTCYFYDPAGRLVRKLANCNDQEDPQEYEDRFEYDAAGRRTLAERLNNGTLIARTRFTFDALSRVTAEEQTVKEETPLTVAGTYDNRGNRIALTLPTGRILEFTYDNLNRLSAIGELSTGNALVDFSYCGPRRVERRRYFKDPGATGGLPASVVSSCTYTTTAART